MQLLPLLCVVSLGFPVLPESRPVADEELLAALEDVSLEQSSARAALELYSVFETTHVIPPQIQQQYAQRLEIWKERASSNLLRAGTDWVSVEKLDPPASAAAECLKEAFELMGGGRMQAARRQLQEASRRNPDGLLAEYLLGLQNSGAISSGCVSHPRAAVSHFETVLQRWPGHVGAMNNLAVACMKEGLTRRAVALWDETASIEPDNAAVRHNIRRTLFEHICGGIQLDRDTLQKLRLLGGDNESLDGDGFVWAISPAVIPDIELLTLQSVILKSRNAQQQHGQPVGLLVQGMSGGCFAVADGGLLPVKQSDRGAAQSMESLMQATLEMASHHVPGFGRRTSGRGNRVRSGARRYPGTVVLVTAGDRDVAGVSQAPETEPPPRVVTGKFHRDPSCVHCKGWGRISCLNPRCPGDGELTFEEQAALSASTKPALFADLEKDSGICRSCRGDFAVGCRWCGGQGINQSGAQ